MLIGCGELTFMLEDQGDLLFAFNAKSFEYTMAGDSKMKNGR
jgi:hypothetical protein